ncbi:MAG: YibE/F family protein [Bacillus sp. (in: Bacteria)]|nr:YibE/F family protein [Bacillus sp. (in: firmicutes)]
MNDIINLARKITTKQYIFVAITAICFIASILFVNNNYFLYERTIAQVVETNLVETTEIVDMHGNEDQLFFQELKAVLKNGEKKGQIIQLTNEYSFSGAYDQKYQVGNEVFVSLHATTENNGQLTGTITDVKRDKYVVLIAWLFIITLLIIAQKQGLFAIISLGVNAILLSFALDIYLNTAQFGLLVVCSIAAILFTVISLLLVNGFNEKTYSAVIATIVATFLSLFITFLVLWVTSENGIRYEAMQFLTRPPQLVFLAGILVGSLGAVMDVAITMSSSIFGLYEKNHRISVKALKNSGMEIGKDIMGTMTNILFFVYISGSIPMLILYLKNYSMLGYTLSINLSMELARALAGGIGIVITIPIGLYTAIYFVNLKRART